MILFVAALNYDSIRIISIITIIVTIIILAIVIRNILHAVKLSKKLGVTKPRLIIL